MRLKEIKPGMVIHCKNISEYERLEDETIKNGYGQLPLHNQSEEFINKVVFYIHDKNCLWGGLNKNYIEFSDLIIPELTAEEAWSVAGEIINMPEDIVKEIFYDFDYCKDDFWNQYTPEEANRRIESWKAEHEKKEPEIETVDICRIIEIQPDGKKRCVHEEDISDGELMYSGDAVENCRYILKNYCKEHDGEFIAVHEVVSRVKAVK